MTKIIQEGQATITHSEDAQVFYSPPQQFNRDLSEAVIRAYHKRKGKKLHILEALAASGLRSIRYAKEMPEVVKKIVANDLSADAVESIKRNAAENGVPEGIIEAHHGDAMDLLYSVRGKEMFDVIDLDPYGTASMFIDGAVQAVKNGGLLCVTCTDLAVLAGNYPEVCFAKYGGVPVKTDACHELALRLVIHSLQVSAARYKRQIIPLVSMSIDYYVRVFVLVVNSPSMVKRVASETSLIHKCYGCKLFWTQQLGTIQPVNQNSFKYGVGRLPKEVAADGKCPECSTSLHVGGPFYNGLLHDQEFVGELLEQLDRKLYGTYDRMVGMLTMVSEELPDLFYYQLGKMAAVCKSTTPSIQDFLSVLLNAGYKASLTHCGANCVKTDAPAQVVLDIFRAFKLKTGPLKMEKFSETSPGFAVMSKPQQQVYNFEKHPGSNPKSRQIKLLRFEDHKDKDFGPRTKAKKQKTDL